MKHEVVLLDVGGTLIGPRQSYGAVYAEVLGPLGFELSAAAADRAIVTAVAAMSRDMAPGADRFGQFEGGDAEYWLRFVRRVLIETTGRDPGADAMREPLDRLRARFAEPSAWVVFDDVVPALESLRRGGKRLGVVSNWDSRLPVLLDRLGVAAYFETVVVSHLEGVEKPDPRLFRLALTRLGALAAQAVHVGDSKDHDVAGAAAAGITSILLEREKGQTLLRL